MITGIVVTIFVVVLLLLLLLLLLLVLATLRARFRFVLSVGSVLFICCSCCCHRRRRRSSRWRDRRRYDSRCRGRHEAGRYRGRRCRAGSIARAITASSTATRTPCRRQT
uniref:Uncharacterized protein n=1 Tax=Anopheles darlingi TaxID=43151 RepID=A0A2M4D1T5_ANODA